MIWFISDLHFNHKNIIKPEYSNRPFDSIEEMNETLIKNWNDKVSPYSDEVYVLGDFALTGNVEKLKGWFDRLNGRKHLIKGNHDDLKKHKHLNWESMEEWAKKIRVGEQRIILSHYPWKVWEKNNKGYWQLYAHCHGNLYDDPGCLQLDVGVDCNNYAPISFEEVAEKMSKKKFKPVDHHR